MKTKKTYAVKGMHCPSCAMLIEGELEDRGIVGTCSYAKQTIEVETEKTDVPTHLVKEAVEAAGYHIVE